MYSEVKKILRDTLQNKGRYSRKSLIMFGSFVVAVSTGVYIVISDYILPREITRYAVDVFNGFLMLTGALSGISVWDKMSVKPNKEKEEEIKDV